MVLWIKDSFELTSFQFLQFTYSLEGKVREDGSGHSFVRISL